MQKELHFFDDETLDWSAPDYGKLESGFAADDDGRLRFEATPIYTFWPPSIGRLHRYNPTARLIVIFRDPFERAFSHWALEHARGDDPLPFSQAIRAEGRRLEALDPLAPERRVWSYLERGLYGDQTERLLAHFPRDQLLFLRLDDLRDDLESTLAKTAAFLGVAHFPHTEVRKENARQPGLGLTAPADRALAADYFAEDFRRFAAVSGVDLSAWKTAPSQPHVGRG